MRSLCVRRLIDIRDSLSTWPDSRTWLACTLVFGAFIAAAGTIGLASGFLRPTTLHLPIRTIVVTPLAVLVQPALLEEIVFRALLLPRDMRSIQRRMATASAALTLYVLSHPINAALFRPNVLPVFGNPIYLTLAAALGATCTAAYWMSKSIWPAVAIHWVTVLMWLWFLGGTGLLHM